MPMRISTLVINQRVQSPPVSSSKLSRMYLPISISPRRAFLAKTIYSFTHMLTHIYLQHNICTYIRLPPQPRRLTAPGDQRQTCQESGREAKNRPVLLKACPPVSFGLFFPASCIRKPTLLQSFLQTRPGDDAV
jgi:hypothetical protein